MNEHRTSRGDRDGAGRYEIRLTGHLDARWATWFDGLSVTHEGDGSTVISGPVADQAALYGLLQRVRDLGLPLVSVTQVDNDSQPIHEQELIPMATTARTAPTTGISMSSMRKTALVAGVLYLLTFLSSIPAVFLQSAVLTDPLFIISGVSTEQVRLGALFDIVNSLTAIGTAVALYAVIKRQNQGFAIGFVSSRLFEATILMIGVVSILSIVTLQQPGATGAEASLLVTVQQTLVTVRNWAFVLGTGVPALNAFLLGWLMYKSRLVPRAIPVIGLIGAPLFTTWIIGYVLGVTEPGTAWHAIGVAPIFIWELSLGLWMTFKGFRKDAPLMVEAAEATSQNGLASVSSSIGVASTAGAA